MKKITPSLKKCFCALAITLTITGVNASTYVQLTKHQSVSTSVGSGTVYCTAKRYITGTTKWSSSSNVICNAMNGYSSCYCDPGSTFDDRTLVIVNVSMTSYSYQYDSTTKNFHFYYDASTMSLS